MLRNITNYTNSDIYRSKVHTLIPGGSHTYSKGDDQFPALSPAAIKYGDGAYVWDLDNNKFLDVCMGLGSVTLGHAYQPVLKKVLESISTGVNFQRPSFLEMEAAEKFLALVPNHDMIKFAKNGSTVTTAAVKLARAYTGKSLVAFPSDHPFYSFDDWFIGKSLCPRGVPEEIQNLSVTFKSYDLNSLQELFNRYPNQIACVITEPEKFEQIPADYLSEAIKLCHKNGALFIADEMVSGFKAGFPGTCEKYGVTPDMSTWGKGMANGFSLCALTGKKEIMNLGGIKNLGQEKVFLISSTHGGETHALSAGIATIEEFRAKNVIKHNHGNAVKIDTETANLISSHKLDDHIKSLKNNWLPVWTFSDEKKQISAGYRTLFLQEMIRRGILFQGFFTPTFSHTPEDINYFINAFEESIVVYKKALLSEGLEKYLVGEPCKPVFRKYI